MRKWFLEKEDVQSEDQIKKTVSNSLPKLQMRSKTVEKPVKWWKVWSNFVQVDAVIRNALEREQIKFGIESNQNNVRAEVAQSGHKTNNQLIDEKEQSDINGTSATHFIVNNGNNDHNRSREHNCPNPAALAKQTKLGYIR